jgi:predicted enzyme related to lactoylglutathione lyase
MLEGDPRVTNGPGWPGGLLVTLCSDDLEARLVRVRAAGGKSPFAFFGGRRSHVPDPVGSELTVGPEG